MNKFKRLQKRYETLVNKSKGKKLLKLRGVKLEKTKQTKLPEQESKYKKASF